MRELTQTEKQVVFLHKLIRILMHYSDYEDRLRKSSFQESDNFERNRCEYAIIADFLEEIIPKYDRRAKTSEETEELRNEIVEFAENYWESYLKKDTALNAKPWPFEFEDSHELFGFDSLSDKLICRAIMLIIGNYAYHKRINRRFNYMAQKGYSSSEIGRMLNPPVKKDSINRKLKRYAERGLLKSSFQTGGTNVWIICEEDFDIISQQHQLAQKYRPKEKRNAT